MKNRRLLYILAVTGTVLLFTACSGTSAKKTGDTGVIDGGGVASTAANVDIASDSTQAAIPSVADDASLERAVQNNTVIDFAFEGVRDYLAAYKNSEIDVDYAVNSYEHGNHRDGSVEDVPSIVKSIDNSISLYNCKSLRGTRSDIPGSRIDFMVYSANGNIDKIVTTEYGSTERTVLCYYFTNARLIYVHRYTDDIIGTAYKDGADVKGEIMEFYGDTLIHYENADKTRDYNSADYDIYSDDIKKEVNLVEEEAVNKAYVTYEAVKNIPESAKITGIVRHETGAPLGNVHVTVTSGVHSYSQEVVTNGDGYYEAVVPVMTDDDYKLSFRYGDWPECYIKGVDIPANTVEYCAGTTYMAEAGQLTHPAEVFNVINGEKAPSNLAADELQIVTTYSSNDTVLNSVVLNLKDKAIKSDYSQVVKINSDSDYKYFVMDATNAGKGSYNTSALALSNAQVKLYNKDGLITTFQVPVDKLGTLWEVFEIKNGRIIPQNNVYFDASVKVLTDLIK